MDDQINLTVGGLMHAKREIVSEDWDLFNVDPTGEAMAVIS